MTRIKLEVATPAAISILVRVLSAVSRPCPDACGQGRVGFPAGSRAKV